MPRCPRNHLIRSAGDDCFTCTIEAESPAFYPQPPAHSSTATKKRGRPRVRPEVPRVLNDLASLPLPELVQHLNPSFSKPTHLQAWTALIERAPHEPIRALCSIPIRHYKTETTCAGIIYILLRRPSWRIIFLTHSHEAAEKWGKRIRQLAEATPVGPTHGWNKISEWRNEAGGGVVVMSADQSKIGYDCDALIVDDPLDEHGAEVQETRDHVDSAITLYTARCIKDGKAGPVLIVASRFHTDDPIGRRLQRTAVQWEYVCSAALIDEGLPTERAFAPTVMSVGHLKSTRRELAETDPYEKIWWAQYQNDPKPIGSDLFADPAYYDKLPDWQYRRGFGVDMAYTVGEGSDWFARVVGRMYWGKLYVLDVTRHKITPHMIESTCRSDLDIYGRAPFYSYMSGPEIGLANLLIERGIPIEWMQARYNKLVRAQKTIRRWNDGDIVLPANSPWTKAFVKRAQSFRGNEKDRDDDEVDALVALSDGIVGWGAGAHVKTLGPAYAGLGAGGMREKKDPLAF